VTPLTAKRRPALFVRLGLVLGLAATAFVLAWPSLAADLTRDLARPVLIEPLARRRVAALSEEIQAAARAAGVEPELLAAVIMAESSGRLGARSKVNALGLCQLMMPTAGEWARRLDLPEPSEERLLTDAAYNTRIGAAYLAWLIERQDGNLEAALVAYNVGPMALTRRVREHGSYEAWRAVAAATGRSELLTYAGRVQRYRVRFEQLGLFRPDANPLDGERTQPE
jgi:soluble lytic murein transglycosylase-like protein